MINPITMNCGGYADLFGKLEIALKQSQGEKMMTEKHGENLLAKKRKEKSGKLLSFFN